MMKTWLKRGTVSLAIAIGTIGVITRAGEVVSMINLLANPHGHVGKEVVVIGVIDTNRMRVYLTREHARANDFASSIGISDPSQDGLLIRSVEEAGCVGEYVSILGTFRATRPAPIADFELVDVKDIFNAESGRSCWRAAE